MADIVQAISRITKDSMQSGTYFSGLIDDVRIYNVALSAEGIAALAQ